MSLVFLLGQQAVPSGITTFNTGNPALNLNIGGSVSEQGEVGLEAAEMTERIMDSLWIQVGQSSIYDGLLTVGKIMLGVGLIFVLYRTYYQVTENKMMDYRQIIAAFIWPIVCILLLVEPVNLYSGQVTTNATNIWAISQTMRGVINYLSKVSISGIRTADGKNPINVFAQENQKLFNVTQAMDVCEQVPEDVRASCYENVKVGFRAIGEGEESGQPSFLQQAIENFNPQQVEFFNPQFYMQPIMALQRQILDQTLNRLLLIVYLMFNILLELSVLLVAIIAPLAVGFSLLPLQSRSIVTWLNGFVSIGMTKIAFLLICAMATYFSFDSNFGGFNTAVALILGIGAPFIAGSVGSFSAAGIQQGVSYMGSLMLASSGGMLTRMIALGRLGGK